MCVQIEIGGHFLNRSMLTFKHSTSSCLEAKSFLYISIYLSKPRRVGGDHLSWPYHCKYICKFLLLALRGMYLKLFKPVSIQTTKVVNFVPSNNIWHSKSNAYKVKFNGILATHS
jgi:hypothetical protein